MEQENQYGESAVEELTPDCNCHCEDECHCHNCHERQPEVFDESDIDRIIANLNDWD
ncbi:MAG: hypothetical protein J6A20_00285 [Muribaculaceae bacterium]|jgi:hypothetical protein|nr:hypothetical protein [Muribaculaceae bacterium]